MQRSDPGAECAVFAADLFRGGVGPLRLLIASACFYRVSNRHTRGVIFQRNVAEPDDAALQQTTLVEAMLRLLRPDGA